MNKQAAITTTQYDLQALARLNDIMTQAGQAANEAGARHAFEDHTARKANNTIRRKIVHLALFETFLQSAGVPATQLHDSPQAWRGITWGIVEAFRNWMLQEGYAIGSINGRLSTARTYARIAARAGAISLQESILIASVQGYASKEAKHIGEKRRADGMQTRKGHKKAEAVTIPPRNSRSPKTTAKHAPGPPGCLYYVPVVRSWVTS